jgi:alkylhydroperoxidase family enzyme
MPPSAPRIPPLGIEQLTDEQAELGGGRDSPIMALNITRTLVRHPALHRQWSPLAEHLGMRSILPPRDREILILRIGELCNEVYEAAHHVHIARLVGMNDAEAEAARKGSVALSGFERTLAKATEELVMDHYITDETWEALAERYTETQLMEVVFVVGFYTATAMVTNSLGVRPEADLESAFKPKLV